MPSTLRTKLALTVAIVSVVAGAAAIAAYAAFSSTVTNSGDNFTAGTVHLTDNGSGSTPVSLTNAVPTVNDTSTGCVTVSYDGTLTGYVKLYQTLTDSQSLAQYLNLTVTRGSFSPSAPSYPSCTNFVPDGGGGVLYNGTLAAYPTSYAAGIADSSTWATGNSHVYKIQVTLQDTSAARNKSASSVFAWEARDR